MLIKINAKIECFSLDKYNYSYDKALVDIVKAIFAKDSTVIITKSNNTEKVLLTLLDIGLGLLTLEKINQK